MCSFLVTSWLIANLTAANLFLKRRGPDSTEVAQHGPFTFVHNLLHMTGQRVPQPFIDGDTAAVYNGEVYNAHALPPGRGLGRRHRSDGECLLPSYKHLGPRFPRALDGEWALVLVDLAERIAVLSTDVFGTKPLWYSLHGGIHAASYESALLALGLPKHSLRMANPNEVLVLRLEGTKAVPVARHAVHEFDLRQFKTTTDDWQRAFRQAVRKRVVDSNHPSFVGLSSGYDSGALHLALEDEAAIHSVNYFTIGAEELTDVVQERIGAFNKSVSRAWGLQLSLMDFKAEKAWLEAAAEPFRYGRDNWAGGSVQEDGAAVGLSAIFRRCRRAGVLVYLSGAGADEVISDYGFAGEKLFPHSSFGGLFPSNLASLFPWTSVFRGTQRDYLMKEEVVAGSHGLEARYPFLDRAVVQEFLWLSAEAKNVVYKRPVHDFLSASGYPFDAGRKDGFAASRNLKLVGPTAVDVTFDAMAAPRAAPVPAAPALAASVPAAPCLEGGAARGGPWSSARSRLAAFLATPESQPEVVEGLVRQLLAMMGGELPNAEEECQIGQLCMRLLLLLLMEPSARTKQLRGGALWPALAVVPWDRAARGGWPLFALLRRLAAGDERPEGEQPPLGGLLPLAGCGGRLRGEEALDLPLALLTAGAGLAKAATAQGAMVAFWGPEAALLTVLESARMCEAFVTLDRLSEPYLRVNFADAWHLLE